MRKTCFLTGFLFLWGIHEGEAMTVHDPTSYASQLKVLEQATEQVNKATEQIQKLDSQLQTMKDQLNQGQEHFKAITGKRDRGGLHHNPALQQVLPSEWQGLYQATKNSISALQELKNTIASIEGEERFDRSVSVNDMQERIDKRMEQTAYTNKAVGLQAYQGLQERTKQVDRLMAEINNTKDPKEIAELQARISIEQAHIQNEMAKVQLVGQLQCAEQHLIDQQKYQMSRRILDPENTVIPKIR